MNCVCRASVSLYAPSRSLPGGESLPASTHAVLDALDSMGRIHWPERRDGKPGFKRYLHEMPRSVVQDIVTDIRPLSHATIERTGYPTQKPLALLERIIKACSNSGDLVLDPFCGCATTLVATDRLDRQWAGIDLSPLAIKLVNERIAEDRGLFDGANALDTPPVRTDMGRTAQLSYTPSPALR